VSVDYCLVPEAQLQPFVQALSAYMQEHFSANNGAAHACGIVSERHMARLAHLLEDARASGAQIIRIGQEVVPGERNMPFSIVVNPADSTAIMREEIFGPILAIKTYQSTQDAVSYVNQGDRPLGLYVFAKDRAFIQAVTQGTHSGGVSINAIAVQAGLPSLGFGGVGPSGMGRHHGEEGFKEFSNPRGFYERGAGTILNWVTPPYGEGTRYLIDKVGYAPIRQQLKFALPRLVKNIFSRTL
jgi:coniferyl-aldehyde dehydrogenase